ncbi:MAG TPA: hypothetical protein ENJ77_01675 [Candidatus Moranbacteria bacterium]|nr:hypothetical protein [Candidatus Moranbacteria bacterium]
MFSILQSIAGNAQVMQSLEASGKTINWGEAIKRLAIDEGVQDWDKIIVDKTAPESVDGVGDDEGTTQTPEQLVVAAREQAPEVFTPTEQSQQPEEILQEPNQVPLIQ